MGKGVNLIFDEKKKGRGKGGLFFDGGNGEGR